MRGADVQQGRLFSFVPVESRIPANHRLRAVRTLLDGALASMSRDFDRVYAEGGRSSVPPERLVRAPAKLHYLGHVLMEHRTGLPVDFDVTEANRFAEREAALTEFDRLRKRVEEILCPRRGSVCAMSAIICNLRPQSTNACAERPATDSRKSRPQRNPSS